MSGRFSNGHERPDTSGIDPSAVLAVILTRGPVKAEEIVKALGLKDGPTSVKVRQVITELVLSGHAIASDARGYFWVRDEADVQAYDNQLASRRDEIERRRVAFVDAANNFLNGGQR